MHQNPNPVPGGLYDPGFDRDSCGFGLIARLDGRAGHRLVRSAIESLGCLTHRGAVAPDRKSADGCGLLLGRPRDFLGRVAGQLGVAAGLDLDRLALGMVFLSPAPERADRVRRVLAERLAEQGLRLLGWRPVPIDPAACGAAGRATLPGIEQPLVQAPAGLEPAAFERALFMARRLTERALEDDPAFHVASLSWRVLSYKALVMPARLAAFYPDLTNPRLASHLCVFHQRFSTNTLPQWRLVQPFRLLAHNGEINTIQGNRNWLRARAGLLESPLLPDLRRAMPLVRGGGSDSESLDNLLEALLLGGMGLTRAVRVLIPPAWQNLKTLDPDLRAFYEYHSMHQEPWDGPAGIVMTDGRHAACTLDRNGLRPARWLLTRDGHIVLASETGVHEVPAREVARKGRLGPGQMIAADTRTGRLLLPDDIDASNRARRPYRQWLRGGMQRLRTEPAEDEERHGQEDYLADGVDLAVYAKGFQLSLEEREQVLRVLAAQGREAVGSMGDDTPLPALSLRVRSLYDYFRQQFAQVTNPPIDPLREQSVMSLETCFGAERNLFAETPAHAERVVLDSPVLSARKLRQLGEFYRIAPLGLGYARADAHGGFERASGEALREALRALGEAALAAVIDGAQVLLLSDRDLSRDRLTVPAPLAVGRVHHRLIEAGRRCDVNLVVATGGVRDPHQFAVLLGYGATAVMPYLAYAMLARMQADGEFTDRSLGRVLRDYRQGINKGLYKVLSRMGISTVTSYRGAQLFEAVGLAGEVVDACLPGTVCRIGGAGFAELEQDQAALADMAWDPRRPEPAGGLLKYLHGDEYHAYNPDVVMGLQRAVRSGDYQDYRRYAERVNGRSPATLRDLLELRPDRPPIPLEQVETEAAILKRFDSAGMSLGALSPEAHETLATAMNRLGGRSNSGEGGEDPARYGTERRSKIKQVASGRFGVTPAYLVNAEVLQIKIAQGAKPGEGGQLPGDKVNRLIARLRCSVPGVTLISPPPHHDIYSIEDLAQLIFDLKQVNPRALVSVKLVAEAGVGTIAAGVTKAYADLITISGYDGGTGASPLTSVKYVGAPWELGIAETQQVLRANGLRGQVRIQADGGLKTGLDVIKAGLLGAESFGFGTAPMVAMGCKYLRICHLNNCATGVATQDETLRREHFAGEAEWVMNYFRFVAREVREWMASLGIARFDDLVGRGDLLRPRPGVSAKQRGLDLTPLLEAPAVAGPDVPRRCIVERNPPFDGGELAERMVEDCLPAIASGRGGSFAYRIRNVHRAIGARLSGEIARRRGNGGLADAPVVLRLTGVAGQSLGAWNVGGLQLHLEGEANDYVGKGMAGGLLVIRPPAGAGYPAEETPIVGNTCLYGATGGRFFAAGSAGERFAVRNSGATAVLEGVGDHGCEYMTGGVVAILGPTGHNFGAGMTGGFAYVLDREGRLPHRLNHELVDLHPIDSEATEPHRVHLLDLLRVFVRETGSVRGGRLLEAFEDLCGYCWLVKPKAAELADLLETLRHRVE